MPKRTTLTYTSYDAPKTDAHKLYVYYCKYSGKHAFTTDTDLSTLPRRKSDNAYVLDRDKHMLKLYTTDGGVKYIRRASGAVERQHRLMVGSLPIGYTSEADGKLVYLMDDAVIAYHRELGASDKAPVPPCIRRGEGGTTEVVVDIDDRSTQPAVGKITAEGVRFHITGNVSHDVSQQELLGLAARTLGLRLTQLTLMRGSGPRNKVLLVEGLTPSQAYRRLKGEQPAKRDERGGGDGHRGHGGRKRRPWHQGL